MPVLGRETKKTNLKSVFWTFHESRRFDRENNTNKNRREGDANQTKERTADDIKDMTGLD